MFKQRFIMIYLSFIKIVARIILALVGSMEILGLENLPPSGPYLIVTNHLSKVDVAIVLLAFPKQQMRVFAADKWRRNPVFGPLLGLSGAIWVRRGQVDRKALREAIQALQDGEVLGMAPEGTRSRDGVLHKGRQGPAYIASRAQVPLVPIGIINSDQFGDNMRRLRRTAFQTKIGRPFDLPDLGYRPKAKELEAYTELIMVQIAHLLPERYHGHYADNPALAALAVGQAPWPVICDTASSGAPNRSDSAVD